MMKNLLEKTNRFFETLPVLLRNRKRLLIAGVVLCTVFLAAGMNRVVIDESIESYFKDDDPVKEAYDRFKSYFGSDEYVYIVYRAKDGDIFSDASLKALSGVHKDLTEYRLSLPQNQKHPLDHIVEVKSLINVKYLEAHDNNLFSRNFIGDRLPENDSQRERLRLKGLNHPDYPKRYLSDNSEYGGIVIRTDFNARRLLATDHQSDAHRASSSSFDTDEDLFEDTPPLDTLKHRPTDKIIKTQKTDVTEYPPFMESLRAIFQKPEYRNVLEFHPVGNPVLMDFFATAVLEDMGRLMSFLILLIIVVLWLLFRSFSAVVWPVVIILLTVIWIMGLIGWLGVPMSAMIQIIIFLALSVGIADSVHILSGYLFFRNQNIDHERAMAAVMRKSGLACLLTSLTTAIGLLSLVLVPLIPIVFFGIFAAVCISFAFMFTVFLLPIMLDLWAPVHKKQTRSDDHLVLKCLKSIETISIKRPKLVISIFAAASIVLIFGMLKLKIDSNFVEIIKKGYPLRDTYTIVDKHLGGTTNMEIMMDFNQSDAFKDPDVLFAVQEVQDHLKESYPDRITLTMSLANVVKDSYKALNNDDPRQYVIPSDPAVLEQVLFLFSNANPIDRRQLVSDDYSRARIGINALNVSAVEALALTGDVQQFINEKFSHFRDKYPAYNVTVTGNMALLAIMLDYISWSQIKSFSLALVVISVVLFLVLGSWKAGIVSLPPNLFPILMTLGLMGFLNVALDADTLLIAPIIIGLAVDDTIHFMTHFRIEIGKTADIKMALIHSLREAGQAICFTSIILSTGFLVFLLSFHNGLSHFGLFAAIAVLTALLADIFLLPALCMAINVDFNKK